MRRPVIITAALLGVAGAGATVLWHRRQRHGAVSSTSQTGRTLQLARLSGRLAADTTLTKARQVFADAPRRAELQHDFELRSAQQVADTLGNMKGALMKLGQMASYLDEGLPPHVREVLSQLQGNAPPMSAELAAGCVEAELGSPPEKIFATWDPEPIAAASIGQVHRAITHDGQAVAVKVQYPGVADAITSDLGVADMVFAAIGMSFTGLNRKAVTDEIKLRVLEELDYYIEASNQQLFYDFYDGHPFIHIPAVRHDLSTGRVLTTELATGATFDEVLGWDQAERDQAAESMFRFAFRSLYSLHAFNGDPHPGNYLFNPGGQVTFLDFGMVRRFTPAEIGTFMDLIRYMVLEPSAAGFRAGLAASGLLSADAPVSDTELVDYFSAFYDIVRGEQPKAFTAEYASAIVRRTFDPTSPVAKYATVPPPYVIIQRINLGLYALLGSLRARADWRRISDELWPGVNGPPSTPMGEAEHQWLLLRASVTP
ncbi:MAG: hypothetical protein JWL70_2985 [Acidimicrobiia bacterium]|nr:hypothetical protein [Acidimicrobiia bacterium]